MGATAAISLIGTAATTGYSFYQSSEQKKQQREAEAAAKLAMDEAKKKLDVNFYKGLGIPKEAYELEREAVLSTQASTIQAGVESRRGAAGIAGMVNMANNAGQRQIATDMGRDIFNLNTTIAQENQALNNQKIELDLGTAKGAQLAARNNEMLSNQSLTQGLQGVTSLAGQLSAQAPLYSKNNSPEANMAIAKQMYETNYANDRLDPNYKKAVTGPDGNPLPFETVYQSMGYTNPSDYIDFLNNQQATPQTNAFGLKF